MALIISTAVKLMIRDIEGIKYPRNLLKEEFSKALVHSVDKCALLRGLWRHDLICSVPKGSAHTSHILSKYFFPGKKQLQNSCKKEK